MMKLSFNTIVMAINDTAVNVNCNINLIRYEKVVWRNILNNVGYSNDPCGIPKNISYQDL